MGAIPARYASTRLPGKALAAIAGRPMIQHVYDRAEAARGLDRVIVLTDDSRIAEAVDRFGGNWEMTPQTCRSGTDRIAFAARNWNARAVVNIQGDEPLIDPEAISKLALHLTDHPTDPIVTLAGPGKREDLANPHVVKVVVDRLGYALYFSRAGIPHPANSESAAPPKTHIGVYGYQIDSLLKLAEFEPTELEQAESLEQLRALENGMSIRVLQVDSTWIGIDTMEDLQAVRSLLSTANHEDRRSSGDLNRTEHAGIQDAPNGDR